ncbi:hypothetical protein OSTOST_17142, partial [Ostertagia ostertagi]
KRFSGSCLVRKWCLFECESGSAGTVCLVVQVDAKLQAQCLAEAAHFDALGMSHGEVVRHFVNQRANNAIRNAHKNAVFHDVSAIQASSETVQEAAHHVHNVDIIVEPVDKSDEVRFF